MGDRLYVSGLPYAVTEAQLHDLFSEHGTVTSARIVTDRFSGRSRGFGFVEMSTEAEAKAAMEALNETESPGAHAEGERGARTANAGNLRLRFKTCL